jgi:hypothetical protein
MVEPEGSQMTSQYGAYKLHAGSARLHASKRMHTHILSNIYCFSTATSIRERALLSRCMDTACLVRSRCISCDYFCLSSSRLVRFKVSAAASIKVTLLWRMTSCSLVHICQCFRGNCYFHNVDICIIHSLWRRQQVAPKCRYMYVTLMVQQPGRQSYSVLRSCSPFCRTPRRS